MKRTAKIAMQTVVHVSMESEVARQVRQHGRSSMRAEVCGVLIGREEGSLTIVDACIAGSNAAQGGAHVTFTQDTWEHIYQVKDKEYPNARIVGWYHSHPGFGVFLSDHDLFIHKNFFSSPQQIAWVYDPHSDEEGCFGWREGKIEKIDDVSVRFGQPCGEAVAVPDDEQDVVRINTTPHSEKVDWWDLLRNAAICAIFSVIGAAGMFYYITSKALLFPRGGSALVIVQDDKLAIVPQALAERMLTIIQSEIDAQMRSLPAGSMQSAPSPAGVSNNSQGKQNVGQK